MPNFSDWRNSNKFGGKFPFAHNATLTNGTVSFPASAFVDMRLHLIGGGVRQYVSQVERTDTQYIFTFSDGVNTLATATLNVVDMPTLTRIDIVDTLGRAGGVIVTTPDRITALASLPGGIQEFDQEQTEIDAVCVTPMPQQGLRSFRTPAGEAAFGDVWLVGGQGVVLEVPESTAEGATIRVNATGDTLFKRLQCESTGFDVPCFLKTINGISPDEYGDFKIKICGLLASDTVLRIVPGDAGLNISVVGGRID